MRQSKPKSFDPRSGSNFENQYDKFLRDEFVDLVDNLLDVSQKGPIDAKVVQDVLQRPFDLGKVTP